MTDIPELDPGIIEAALRTGEKESELRAYFGDDLYEELCHLSTTEPPKRRSERKKILILPGIMGSKLSVSRQNGDLNLIWVDPLSLADGGIKHIAWPNPVIASGVLQTAYLRMKLRLRWYGHDATFYPFDWRSGVHELGEALAKDIKAAEHPTTLVCHSMGGLVARKAASLLDAKLIPRIVTAGTPNWGSYSPVTVMRLTHDYVHLLARLTIGPGTGPKDLVRKYISKFPGLIEMLPNPEKRPDEAFFDAGWWPGRTGVVPTASVLADGRSKQGSLPLPDERFFQIVGIGQETLVGTNKDSDRLAYEYSMDGDGTVPRDLAECDPVTERYYVNASHGSLFNKVSVIRAVRDLVEDGKTNELGQDLPDLRSEGQQDAVTRSETEARDLAKSDVPSRSDPNKITEARLLSAFASGDADIDDDDDINMGSRDGDPTSTNAGISGAGANMTAEDKTYTFMMSRRRRRRLDVGLMKGDLLDVPAECYVLGIFEGVTNLAGAAGVVDEALEGALSVLIEDRQITGRAGEITILPTPRYVLRTSMVAVVGLGPAGSPENVGAAIRLGWRNLARTLCIANVSTVATVLMGSTADLSEDKIFDAIFEGLFESLELHDPDQMFSSVLICERDDARAQRIENHLTQLFSHFGRMECEIVLRVERVKTPAIARARVSAKDRERVQPTVINAEGRLIQENASKRQLALNLTFTEGSSGKIWKDTGTASAASSSVVFDLDKLDSLVADLRDANYAGDAKPLKRYAKCLEEIIFDENTRNNLMLDPSAPLSIVNTPWASRVPWELLHANDTPIALEGGISRQYRTPRSPVSRTGRRTHLRGSAAAPNELVLLISDPTKDLHGARVEADRLQKLFSGGGQLDRFDLAKLSGDEATLERVTGLLSAGLDAPRVDVLHYAGHAFFDPEDRSSSGLILSDGSLVGAEIESLPNVPRFVFLNACESGRVRRFRSQQQPEKDLKEPKAEIEPFIRRNIGLTEAFIVSGVANLIGTIWPVGDTDAGVFSEKFYEEVAQGRTLGQAIREARIELKDRGTWVNYLHYGEMAAKL